MSSHASTLAQPQWSSLQRTRSFLDALGQCRLGATEALVLDRLPEGAWLTGLGTHPLRDLSRPERVVQLCHPNLVNEFPPLRTPKAIAATNLPVQLTSFIGRGAELVAAPPSRGRAA